MTLMLELSPEKEAWLREQAAQSGQEPEQYALGLIDQVIAAHPSVEKPRPFYEAATPEEWEKAFDEWTASLDPNTPVLLDDRREVIYED